MNPCEEIHAQVIGHDPWKSPLKRCSNILSNCTVTKSPHDATITTVIHPTVPQLLPFLSLSIGISDAAEANRNFAIKSEDIEIDREINKEQ